MLWCNELSANTKERQLGRQRYEISAEDYSAAEGWIGRHLPELPPETVQALREASSPAGLQSIVDRFLTLAQRSRLHAAIRQSRHRDRQRSICVTLSGKTADLLYLISEWRYHQPPARILEELIFLRWNEMFGAQIREIEQEMGRALKYDEREAKGLELIAARRSKAGQKLDK